MNEATSKRYSVAIAGAGELGRSREVWNSLVRSMPLPTVFLTWEWITTWFDHFGDDYAPLVLFITDEGGRLIGIAPFAQKDEQTGSGIIRLRSVTMCGANELHPDHLDIICAGEHRDACIEKTICFFRDEYHDWDVLKLDYLAEGGHLAGWLESEKGLRTRLVSRTVAPYITAPQGDRTILDSFSAKKRYNIKREARILFGDKLVYFTRVDSPAEIEDGLRELFRLHKLRAEEKGISSTFEGDRLFSFHVDLAGKLFESGSLELYLLKSGDTVISAVYGFVFEDRFFYYQTGLHPDWQRYSAGKVLLLKVLDSVFDKGLAEFDFLGGDEEYKTFWTDRTRTMVSYNIYNANVSGLTADCAGLSKNLVKFILKKTSTYDAAVRLIKKR